MTREKAILWLIDALTSPIVYGDYAAAISKAIEALQREDNLLKSLETNKPIYDMVEVVRCKDCRHRVFTKDGESNPHDIVCDYHMSDGFDETDFCSYGERKGGDTE